MAIETEWTLEDFLRLPETKPALEFECGRITQKMSPSTEHSLLQLRLGRMFDDLGLGRSFPELRTILAPNASKVPDLAFYLKSELPSTPRGGWLRYPEWSPTVAIEIASPGQSMRELRTKCQFYVDQGSRVALLVQPKDESVEVFAKDTAPQTCTGGTPLDVLVREIGDVAASITPAAIFDALKV